MPAAVADRVWGYEPGSPEVSSTGTAAPSGTIEASPHPLAPEAGSAPAQATGPRLPAGPRLSGPVSARQRTADLWRRYHDQRDECSLADLVRAHMPLVRYVATRLLSSVPARVDVETLAAYGVAGLSEAIVRFEPDRGFRFETFAVPRIRGAMLDEIRSADWAPRSVRSKARTLSTAYEELAAALRRTPTPAELARHVGLTTAEVNQVSALARRGRTSALDQDASTLSDTAADPAFIVEQQEERRALRRALLHLKERERQVLELYYFEEFTLAQIADRLGVTEGRVSQIRSRAVASMTVKLRAAEARRRSGS